MLYAASIADVPSSPRRRRFPCSTAPLIRSCLSGLIWRILNPCPAPAPVRLHHAEPGATSRTVGSSRGSGSSDPGRSAPKSVCRADDASVVRCGDPKRTVVRFLGRNTFAQALEALNAQLPPVGGRSGRANCGSRRDTRDRAVFARTWISGPPPAPTVICGPAATSVSNAHPGWRGPGLAPRRI
jgi:hypothetical protein